MNGKVIRDMTCQECRDGLSAAMDHQSWPEQDTVAQAHLAGCVGCRQWQISAELANRALRLRPAESVPDLSARITDAVLSAGPSVVRNLLRRIVYAVSPRPAGWRALLGVVALAQLTLGMSEILGVVHGLHVSDGAGEHLFNESSAWNVALGVGFAGAAIWPKLAAGMLPTLGIFTAILLVLSVTDLAGGHVGGTRVATHAVLVVGLLVMLMVHRDHRHPPLPATAGDDALLYGDHAADDNGITDNTDARSSARAPHRRGLRPVGHRAA